MCFVVNEWTSTEARIWALADLLLTHVRSKDAYKDSSWPRPCVAARGRIMYSVHMRIVASGV